jgi:hypothetical protein
MPVVVSQPSGAPRFVTLFAGELALRAPCRTVHRLGVRRVLRKIVTEAKRKSLLLDKKSPQDAVGAVRNKAFFAVGASHGTSCLVNPASSPEFQRTIEATIHRFLPQPWFATFHAAPQSAGASGLPLRVARPL